MENRMEKYDWYDDGVAKGKKVGIYRGLFIGFVVGMILMFVLTGGLKKISFKLPAKKQNGTNGHGDNR